MRIAFAVESLLPQERAPRAVLSAERYGRSLSLVAFGRRWLVDLIRRRV